MLLKVLAVGSGGFVGAACRYLVSMALQRYTGTFPWATLGINVLGCFVIGLIQPPLDTKGREIYLAFFVPGILGGFTTFSAFGHETHGLVQREAQGLAAIYVAASVLLGLGAVWLGRAMVK